MKKLHKYILLTLMITLGFSSCEIESEVYNVINEDLFPKNEDDAEALITASAYGPFRSNYYSGIFTVASGGIQTITEMTTDIGECQWNDPVWPDVLYQNFRPSSTGITQFYGYRSSISRMTNSFKKIEEIEMPQEKKDLYNAELHLARGWLTFLLYDLYGPIPIATVEQLENPLTDEIIARPTREWMVSFIEDELKSGINGVPSNYDKSSADYGRFTKALGYTILMKLYMHEKDWTNAVQVGKELMKSEYKLELVPEYKDIFTLENEKNEEIIFATQNSRGTNMQLWLAHVLSSEYPTNNTNIQKWGGYRVLWSFYNKFDPNDKRLDVLAGKFIGTDGKLYNEDNPGTVLIKGALPVKYGEDPAAVGEESQIDWVVYRYADVLTLLSEAIVRSNEVITQEAVDLINMIRNRAGLDSYTMNSFENTQDFYDKVLLERGRELWFEGHRRSDLIRHGKYIEYSKKYKGSTATNDNFVLMPLPQSAIDEGKGEVHQNPGY